jgi:hypothetical protein
VWPAAVTDRGLAVTFSNDRQSTSRFWFSEGDGMNKFLTFAIALGLVACGGTNPNTGETPPGPLTLEKTPVGTVSGTASTVAIGATGGSISNSSAGAKVIVPAGAMPDGSSLSIQAISNPAADAKPGIRLSGSDWTQPITVQFTYPASLKDPENQMISVQNPDGTWVSSSKVKVDGINRTISIRLAADPSSLLSAAGLKPTATSNTRDIIWTNNFLIAPTGVTVQCGASQKFTAYARGARLTNGKKYTQEFLDLIDREDWKQRNLEYLEEHGGEEALGTLLPRVKAYPLKNEKPGFERYWYTTGPGTISPSGVYTAPSDKSADGKVVTVVFTSINQADKTKILVVTEYLRIKCSNSNTNPNDPYARNGGY